MHPQDKEELDVTLTDKKGGQSGRINAGPVIGQMLAGKYVILELLGTGGMGSVYKVKHQVLGKTFALKMLHPYLGQDEVTTNRFRQEARAASKLVHKNIIGVSDFAVDNERLFLIMDYLEGTSLSHQIQETGALPVSRALHIWIQVCSGVSHAHSQGILHRDLKPSNIMLISSEGDADSVKIVDFGVAKILPTDGEELQKLTQTGEIVGSPFYMSPEQYLGNQPDARSDIYSLGCLMYETVVGRPPFVGNTIFETMQMHLDAQLPSVRQAVDDPDTAQRLDYVLCKAMAKDPATRYQSAAELLADLEKMQSGTRTELSTKVAQKWHILQTRISQSMRKKPVRLMALLLLTLVPCALSVSFLASAEIPAFSEKEWPLFSLEYEPSAASKQPLGQIPKLARWLPLLRKTAGQDERPRFGEDEWLRRFRSLIAAEARNGQYQDAAKDAALLMTRMSRFPEGIRALEDKDAPDREEYVIDSEAVADACYYTRNFPLAVEFYKGIQDVYATPGYTTHKRLSMKSADCFLRMAESNQGNVKDNMSKADKAFADATRQEGHGEGPIVQSFDDSDTPVRDRALFNARFGDFSMEEKRWDSAIEAYRQSAREWKALSKIDVDNASALQAYAAQSYLRLYQAQLAQAQKEKKPSADAEQALKDCLQLSRQLKGTERNNDLSIMAELSKLYASENRWFDWLKTNVEMRVESKLRLRAGKD